jgi:predicted aspartyl protease
MTYQFEKSIENGVIFVTAKLDGKHTFRMMLDTGASYTTIDVTALYMAGYSIGNNLETEEVETANGIVEVGILEVDNLMAFGHTVSNIPVRVYDFMAHGILTDYDGLLGLDFFENTMFCIDMKNNTIEVK